MVWFGHEIWWNMTDKNKQIIITILIWIRFDLSCQFCRQVLCRTLWSHLTRSTEIIVHLLNSSAHYFFNSNSYDYKEYISRLYQTVRLALHLRVQSTLVLLKFTDNNRICGSPCLHGEFACQSIDKTISDCY